MSNKYRQAIANAMMGKCIPYKKETKAVLNEMLDMVTIKCGYWRTLTESEITGWNPNLAGYDPVGGYICFICVLPQLRRKNGRRCRKCQTHRE